MALKNILETIKAEANQEIEKIKTEGEKKIKSLQADFKTRRIQEKERIFAETELEAQKRTKQEKFKAESEKKSETLSEKQKVLNESFAIASENMLKLPESKQVELITKLIKNLPKDKEGKLIPVAKSAELVKKANEKARYPLQVAAESTQGKGGFIFTSTTVEIDNRYSTLVNQVREETETEIAKLLFA